MLKNTHIHIGFHSLPMQRFFHDFFHGPIFRLMRISLRRMTKVIGVTYIASMIERMINGYVLEILLKNFEKN